MSCKEWQEFDESDDENSEQIEPFPMGCFVRVIATGLLLGIAGGSYVSGYEDGMNSVNCDSVEEVEE